MNGAKRHDEEVSPLVVDCTVFGALDAMEMASFRRGGLFMSLCQCSHMWKLLLNNTSICTQYHSSMILASVYQNRYHVAVVAANCYRSSTLNWNSLVPTP